MTTELDDNFVNVLAKLVRSAIVIALTIGPLLTAQAAKTELSKALDNDYSSLKKTIVSSELDMSKDFSKVSYEACYSSLKRANGDISKANQAYLWCALGDKRQGITTTKRQFSSSGYALEKMYKKSELKQHDAKLAAIWRNQKKAQEYLKKLELPSLLVKVREEMRAEKEVPIFSAYINDEFTGYLNVNGQLDAYADGRVLFRGVELTRDLKALNTFMNDLKRIGFYGWPQPSYDDFSGDLCDMACDSTGIRVIARNGLNVKRYYSQAGYDAIGHPKPPARFKGGVKRYEVLVRMAHLRVLMERYFPTQKLRCSNVYGKQNVSFTNKCLHNDQLWEKQINRE